MQDFRKLTVRQSSMHLARGCYEITESFPGSELFSLTSQLRRSAVSIPSSIAEGCGRGSKKKFARYPRIAYGSACELGTQLELAQQIPVVRSHELAELLIQVEDVRRILTSFIQQVDGPNS
jgi:four helix bundle protein